MEKLSDVFNEFYDLLTQVAEATGITLFVSDSAVHITAHEKLIDLAEKYDPDVAIVLEERLVKDSTIN